VVDYRIINEYNTDLGHVNSAIGTTCFKEYKEEYKMTIKKSELKDYDKLTYRNGCVRTLIKQDLIDEDGDAISNLSNYNEDLTTNYGTEDNDIVKVERYVTIFKRKEKFKITMKQIAEKFGQDVDDILIERGDD